MQVDSGWPFLFNSDGDCYGVICTTDKPNTRGSGTDCFFSFSGLKNEVGAFFIMIFSLVMVAYTASSMALAIAAGQSVVSVATLLMTISFVFMMVSMDREDTPGYSSVVEICFVDSFHWDCVPFRNTEAQIKWLLGKVMALLPTSLKSLVSLLNVAVTLLTVPH